ncbi:MAG: purine-binding chemotaxis protein CheW, partial [Planctomycetota bacterium]
VIEIVGLQQITEVPDMPEYVMGVINLRGSVIPVVCVRRRFNMPPKEHDERTCVVVVQIADISVGLIVDEVDEVLEITADQVTPPPRVRADGASRFVAGLGKVGEAVKILLDVERLLRDGDIQQLAQIDE